MEGAEVKGRTLERTEKDDQKRDVRRASETLITKNQSSGEGRRMKSGGARKTHRLLKGSLDGKKI